MTDALIFYIDRLREGKEERIQMSVSPDFLDIHEASLQFHSPLSIKGKAYLAEDHLVLQLALHVEGEMQCSICNEMASFPIKLPDFTDTIPLSEIKGNLYDCKPILREAILLEVPHYVECKGNCPRRAELKKYLTERPSDQDLSEGIRFPFTDLNHD